LLCSTGSRKRCQFLHRTPEQNAFEGQRIWRSRYLQYNYQPSIDLSEILFNGTVMLRVYDSRFKIPKPRYFQFSKNFRHFLWFSNRKSLDKTIIRISQIHEIILGQKTIAFKKNPDLAKLEDISFTIVFRSNCRGEMKALDLICKTSFNFNIWVNALLDISRNRWGEHQQQSSSFSSMLRESRQQKKIYSEILLFFFLE
jgi:hypothetical protein